MNKKFEFHMNQIIKIMAYKIYFQFAIAIIFLITAIYLLLTYEDPFHTYLFVGVISFLLMITSFLMISMRKKLFWLLDHYQTQKDDVFDYLNIYIKNIEHNVNRNLIFRISQKKEIFHYHEAFNALTGTEVNN